jgi:acetylornithine deacetylase
LLALVAERCQMLGLEFRRFKGGEPLWVDRDASWITEFCQLAGGPPQTVCYGTDGGELSELERRVVIGPGDIAQAHTTDEWIDLDQLQRAADLYARAIRRWCAG